MRLREESGFGQAKNSELVSLAPDGFEQQGCVPLTFECSGPLDKSSMGQCQVGLKRTNLSVGDLFAFRYGFKVVGICSGLCIGSERRASCENLSRWPRK